MIGGISYFHEFAYDLLAENERILASTFDAAIAAHRDGHLARIIVVSSLDGLRVGDRLSRHQKGAQLHVAPADSAPTASRSSPREYFAKGAWEQYQLPTPSSARSTASGSASDGPYATRTSCRGT